MVTHGKIIHAGRCRKNDWGHRGGRGHSNTDAPPIEAGFTILPLRKEASGRMIREPPFVEIADQVSPPSAPR